MVDSALLYDEEDIRLRVAAHVLAYMAERGVGQNEVARRAHVGSGRISRFITGARNKSAVSIGFVMRLANAIESSPNVILREPPPARFYEEAKRRASAPPREHTPPREASPASARTGKRTAAGRT